MTEAQELQLLQEIEKANKTFVFFTINNSKTGIISAPIPDFTILEKSEKPINILNLGNGINLES